jgi:hypothetical protein
MNGSMLSSVPPRIQVSAIKFQIPSTKIQKNPKSQYPMTNDQIIGLFGLQDYR